MTPTRPSPQPIALPQGDDGAAPHGTARHNAASQAAEHHGVTPHAATLHGTAPHTEAHHTEAHHNAVHQATPSHGATPPHSATPPAATGLAPGAAADADADAQTHANTRAGRHAAPAQPSGGALALLAASDAALAHDLAAHQVLALDNTADVLQAALHGIERVQLHFPSLTDGRAFSQAFLLRRRRGFAGDIRATGDVLIDQLQQMQRCGFSSAVLRADQRLDDAQRQLARYRAFYQGDAVQPAPPFQRTAG